MYRIAELERVTRELRGDVRELRGRLGTAERRIRELEDQTPHARQLQLEADLAAADLAESGCDLWPPEGADRHGPGCQCPECHDPESAEPIEARPRGCGEEGCPDNCPGAWRGCDYYDEGEPPEPGDYDSGPEADDEGGMSEYGSYAAIQDTWGER